MLISNHHNTITIEQEKEGEQEKKKFKSHSKKKGETSSGNLCSGVSSRNICNKYLILCTNTRVFFFIWELKKKILFKGKKKFTF